MNRAVAALLIFSLGASLGMEALDGEEDLEGRITMEGYAIKGQVPYQVSLKVYKGSESVRWCSGALLSKKFTLTSASCGYEAEFIIAYFGAHNRTNPKEEESVTRSISDSFIKVHPKYKPLTGANDVALLETEADLEFTEYISPVSLADKSQSYSDKMAFVSSWVEGSKPQRNILKFYNSKVISNEQCQLFFPTKLAVTPKTLCTISIMKKALPCRGDSGAPLIHRGPEKDYIVGVFSKKDQAGCRSKNPIIYTRITEYADWIKQVTGI